LHRKTGRRPFCHKWEGGKAKLSVFAGASSRKHTKGSSEAARWRRKKTRNSPELAFDMLVRRTCLSYCFSEKKKKKKTEGPDLLLERFGL